MSAHQQEELSELKEKLLLMASRAEDVVSRSVRSVIERDDTLALQVKEDDSVLDQFEVDIDEMSIGLLAKAPLASDLRLIAVAMKISHDLERVGDEATTVARQALQLNKQAPITEPPGITRMAEISLHMLRSALDAFVNRTPDNARAVIPRDKEVDALNRELNRHLLAVMMASSEAIGRGLHWLRVGKSLERIADHATNIAEEVVYLYEGRDIRHAGKAAAAT